MAQSLKMLVAVCLFLTLALQDTRAQCPAGSETVPFLATCEGTAGQIGVTCNPDEPFEGTVIQLLRVFEFRDFPGQCIRLLISGLNIIANLRDGFTSCQVVSIACITEPTTTTSTTTTTTTTTAAPESSESASSGSNSR